MAESERNTRLFFQAHGRVRWNLFPSQRFHNLCCWGTHSKAVYLADYFWSVGEGRREAESFAGKMTNRKLNRETGSLELCGVTGLLPRLAKEVSSEEKQLLVFCFLI